MWIISEEMFHMKYQVEFIKDFFKKILENTTWHCMWIISEELIHMKYQVAFSTKRKKIAFSESANLLFNIPNINPFFMWLMAVPRNNSGSAIQSTHLGTHD